MITIINFNPAIDKMYYIDEINKGEVNRVKQQISTPGGKGINVAKVCKHLGITPTCIGFLGGYNGKYIKDELEKAGIEDGFTSIEDETRICLNIVDKYGESTEILEKGPNITEINIIDFEKNLESVLEKTSILVASGSMPKGLPKDYYEKIGIICRNKGILFVLDASGDGLRYGLRSKPYLIKPNINELQTLLNRSINSKEEAIYGARELLEQGPINICVSLGSEGMILINREDIYEVEIPSIRVVNTVGSGDSAIAGFVYGILNNYSFEKSLKLSNACGMSNSCNEKTGYIDIEEVKEFMKSIKVTHREARSY